MSTFFWACQEESWLPDRNMISFADVRIWSLFPEMRRKPRVCVTLGSQHQLISYECEEVCRIGMFARNKHLYNHHPEFDSKHSKDNAGKQQCQSANWAVVIPF